MTNREDEAPEAADDPAVNEAASEPAEAAPEAAPEATKSSSVGRFFRETGELLRDYYLTFDRRVLGFTLGVTLLTGFVFGLVPALQLSKTDLTESLKDGRGAGHTAGAVHVPSLCALAPGAITTDAAMSTFQIDCELEYDVAAQTVFVFNIAVPDDHRQRVVEERVELEPSLHWDELREPQTLNRFIRVDAAPGPFRVRYLAVVDVTPIEADTQAAEVPITALPVDAFACLRGSKYCQS